MSQPFEIRFDFVLAPSDLIIPLEAIATLHHSEPYYVIDHIYVERTRHPDHPVLPSFEIKEIQREGANIWVHCDSEKESLLSIAAGKAIERARG